MSVLDKLVFALAFYAWGTGTTAMFVFFGAWGWLAFFGPFILVWAGQPILRWNEKRMYRQILSKHQNG